MSQHITIEDIFSKIRELTGKEIAPIPTTNLTKKEKIIIKYFDKTVNLYSPTFDDKESNTEFYSFMSCIFHILTAQSDIKYINDRCLEFFAVLRKGLYIKTTPTYIFTKSNIVSYLDKKKLTNDLIMFISIFFNINIFIINDINQRIYFYTSNTTYNKYKPDIILYKNLEVNIETAATVNFYYTFENVTKEHINKLLLLPIIIYEQHMVDSDIENNKIVDTKQVKIFPDDDLDIIKFAINESKKQRSKILPQIQSTQSIPPRISMQTSSTVPTDIVDSVMVNSWKYTPEELHKKKMQELREIARLNGISLSIYGEKTKIKTKSQLIMDLLKIV